MKKIFLAISALLFSWDAAAAPTTIGLIDEMSGDLYIQVLDDPNAPPYEAAALWAALKGDDSKKRIQTDSFSLECQTTLAEPQKSRFGSCVIDIKGRKVKEQFDGYGALFSGAEALAILGSFSGGEDADHPWSQELRFASGSLMIEAAHPMKLFSLLIKKDLIR